MFKLRWIGAGFASMSLAFAAGAQQPQLQPPADATMEAVKADAADVRIEVTEAGDEPRRELRYTPEVGHVQLAIVTLRMHMATELDGMAMPAFDLPEMRMNVRTEVNRVDDDGNVHYSAEITEAEAVETDGVVPDVQQQMNQILGRMVGLAGVGVTTDRGIPVRLTWQGPATADPQIGQFLESMSQSLVEMVQPLPEEAVGAGAKWASEQEIAMRGVTVTQRAESELTELNDEEATFRVRITQSAGGQRLEDDEIPPGMTVNLKGVEGETTGQSRQLFGAIFPYLAEAESVSTIEMELEQEGHTQSMKQEIRTDASLRSEE